mmetsp:Transcript_30776/g.69200  ORF Transcript_30776/g.69200 Transcript_30776/m.69200 type:complete len:239 (+) Transcript_30776:567-1283(+)
MSQSWSSSFGNWTTRRWTSTASMTSKKCWTCTWTPIRTSAALISLPTMMTSTTTSISKTSRTTWPCGLPACEKRTWRRRSPRRRRSQRSPRSTQQSLRLRSRRITGWKNRQPRSRLPRRLQPCRRGPPGPPSRPPRRPRLRLQLRRQRPFPLSQLQPPALRPRALRPCRARCFQASRHRSSRRRLLPRSHRRRLSRPRRKRRQWSRSRCKRCLLIHLLSLFRRQCPSSRRCHRRLSRQ